MSFRRVLVTGGAGFVGSHLVDGLLRDGFEVSVLDDLSTGTMENIVDHRDDESFHFVKGDIRERHAVEDALKGVDAVFHLAAVTSVPFSVENPAVTREVNVLGTRNLLEACLRGNVERFVYVSTCAVYGEPEYLPVDEGHRTVPVSPYAVSKLESERVCGLFQERYGLKTEVLRLFNVYGLRMRSDQYGGVVGRFVECLRNGRSPVIFGDGLQTRDFVSVGDVVAALRLVLSLDSVGCGVFNVGSGEATSIIRLVEVVSELLGVVGVRPVHRAVRLGDVRHSYACIDAARRVLGYSPKVSLRMGLSVLTGCSGRVVVS